MLSIADVSAALSSLKAAYDLAKGLENLSADAKVKVATIDLMQKILEAQQAAFAAQESQAEMLARIRDLETQLARIAGWEREKARYELREFPAGTFAYVLKESEANGEPHHRLCAKCFEHGTKSILHTERKHSGGERVRCHVCEKSILLSEFPPVTSDPGPSYY